MVPPQRPDLQSAQRVEALGLTRRFVGRSAEAAGFLVFNTVGKVVQHARRTLLRLTTAAQQALVALARANILVLSPT